MTSIANGFNGVDVLVYRGATMAQAKAPVGQGDMTITINGEPIPINNKSSGGWAEYLSDPNGNNSTEKSIEATVAYTMMPDAEQLIERKEGLLRMTSPRIFVVGDMYLKGNFISMISELTGSKDQAVTMSVTYKSSGRVSFHNLADDQEMV